MNENEVKVKVLFQGNEFLFNFGSEAYIFHTTLYNNMHKNYCLDEVLRYVTFVHDCYIDDDNQAPLGSLCDYIAQRWNKVKNRNSRNVLREFYSS